MPKKYSKKDLFTGSLFGEAIAEAKEWLKVMGEVITAYKAHGEAAKKQVVSVNELSSEGMEEVTKSVKKLTKGM